MKTELRPSVIIPKLLEDIAMGTTVEMLRPLYDRYISECETYEDIRTKIVNHLLYGPDGPKEPLKESKENYPEFINKIGMPNVQGGSMAEVTTGAQRRPIAERYDLIPPLSLQRLALVYAEGADRYGPDNYKKGLPIGNIINHLIAHLMKYQSGDRSEDHPAKIAWAAFTLMWFEENNDTISKQEV